MKIDNPYQELADAIIVQAIKDYRKARRTYSSGKIREIRNFFRSSYFTVLCDLDPEVLITKLDQEEVLKN